MAILNPAEDQVGNGKVWWSELCAFNYPKGIFVLQQHRFPMGSSITGSGEYRIIQRRKRFQKNLIVSKASTLAESQDDWQTLTDQKCPYEKLTASHP